MTKTFLQLLFVLCNTLLTCGAFTSPSKIKTSRVVHAASSSPIGDLISVITGVAPSSLQPPLDILRGTSIDPDRDDVDLGRVYKVRVDRICDPLHNFVNEVY